MDTNGPRRGAATPPRQTCDRAATARRIRAITFSTALAGAGAVAAFGLIAAQSGAGTTQAVATVSTTTTAPVIHAAPAAVSAGSGPGQVVSGGS